MTETDTAQHARETAVHARESANAFRRAAKAVSDGDAARVLERCADRREATAEALDQAIWRMNALTERPNADLETVRDLGARIGAMTELTDTTSLIEACRHAEQDVARAASATCEDPRLPRDVRRIAAGLRDDVSSTLSGLDTLGRQD